MTRLEAMIKAAKDAGDFAREGYGHAGVWDYKEHDAAHIVTRYDIEAERRIAAALEAYDPSIPFVGEENGGEHGERFWLVDPIDGTGYFARGMPLCTTMIAFIEHGEATLSVIYNFVTGELYTAEKGKGAFLNGAPIHVNERPLVEAYVGIEADITKPGVAKALQLLMPKVVWSHTISCGYEFGKIAEGKMAARIQVHAFGSDHDFAPGGLLVAEAGGIVRTIGSDSFDFRKKTFIASSKPVYDELMSDPELVRALEEVAAEQQ